MEALQKARILYKQRYQQQVLAFPSDQHTYQLEAKMQRFIEIAIKEVPSVMLFQTPDYLYVFERALKNHAAAASDLTALAKAYENLEKYFLQLVEQPWKREFKRIKLYGGFYRTRIKTALPEPESIFRQAGYSLQLDKQVLELQCPVQIDRVLMLAFDSHLCKQQCQAITEHYKAVKGLSVTFDQAVMEILYSDRSRGRNEVFIPPGYESSGLQVNLHSSGDEMRKNKGYGTLSSSSNLPHIPKREPIEKSSSVKCVLPEESFDPLLQVQNRKVERQPDHFDFGGTMDEHFLRSLQTVGQIPYQPTETSKNGHVGPIEWNTYYQLQQQRKREKNNIGAHEIPASNSALHNVAVTTQHMFPYPPTVAGMQKGSIIESFDDGIEKDLSPMSKSSRDMSTCYPSISIKSGFHQGVATTKLPSSSMQPSLADQGYNTAYRSNGHPTISSPASSAQVHQQQPQHISGSGIYSDGVNSPPIGPPPIPPRALKPDFGVKGNVGLPHDIIAYSSSTLTQQKAEGDNVLPHSFIAKNNPVISNNLSEPSVISSSSSTLPMPSPKLSHSGPILRKDQHFPLGKSSSLKDNVGAANGGTSSSSLLQQSNPRRGARSMDLSRLEWQCHRCTSKNLSSDTVCSVCSTSRLKSSTVRDGSYDQLEPFDIDPVPGMSKKPCPACTLENEPDRTHCSLCEAKLEDPFTYV